MRGILDQMENICLFSVAIITLTVFLENCVRDKEKQIAWPSFNFHGLFSHQRELSTNQLIRNFSVIVTNALVAVPQNCEGHACV